MKHGCRYLLIFGVVYTLGIWGFSAYFFHSQVKKMEALFDQAHNALFFDEDDSCYVLAAAPYIARGFYYCNWKAAGVCDGLSAYYSRSNVYDQAIFWNYMEEKIIRKSRDEQLLFFTYLDLSKLFLNLNNIDNAEYYIMKAEQYLKKYQYAKTPEPHYNDIKIGSFYYTYGKILYNKKQFDDAIRRFNDGLPYFEKSLKNRKSKEVIRLQGYSSYYIAKSFFALNDDKEAEKRLEKALLHFAESGTFRCDSPKCFLLLCQIYGRTNREEQAGRQLDVLTKECMDFLDFSDFETVSQLRETYQ